MLCASSGTAFRVPGTETDFILNFFEILGCYMDFNYLLSLYYGLGYKLYVIILSGVLFTQYIY